MRRTCSASSQQHTEDTQRTLSQATHRDHTEDTQRHTVCLSFSLSIIYTQGATIQACFCVTPKKTLRSQSSKQAASELFFNLFKKKTCT